MTTIVSSTNRVGSASLKLAKYYQKLFLEKGVEVNLLSFTDLPDNLIVSDMYGNRSPEFQKIQDLVNDTQKFIFIIPEYNGSFPGILKTFIDCCKFPESFRDKKAVLVGLANGTYGNVRGIEHFTGICNYIGLNVMPLRLHIPKFNTEMDEEGNLTNPVTINFVDQQITKAINF